MMDTAQRDRQARVQKAAFPHGRRPAQGAQALARQKAGLDVKIATVLTLTMASALLAVACSGVDAARGEQAAREGTADCPATHELTMQTCLTSPPVGYGTLASKPLEWGATRAGAIYFGRLVCPGGGLAMSSRSQPRTDLALEGIETWEIRCPGDPSPHIWYATPRKCGNPCPPDGLRVIPEAALERYLASVAAFETGDVKLALARVDEAVRLAPPNELLMLWKGTMLEQSGRSLEAVPFYEAAVRMNPDEPAHKLFLARAQRAAGHEAPYRSAILDLLSKLPSGHPLVPELQCLEAELLKRDGKEAESYALAQLSCKNGHSECCPGK